MTLAAPIDTGILPWPDVVAHGIVAVHDYGFARSTAVCSCGWAGKRRFLKAAAEQDAWLHSMHEKCTVSVPLVIPVSWTALLPQDLLQQ
ncbi:hypothetical protein [Mycobacterium sp. MMS18-G62]